MESLIWVCLDWKRFINYDSDNNNLPVDASYVTLKELDEDTLTEIRIATRNQVQLILSNYI